MPERQDVEAYLDSLILGPDPVTMLKDVAGLDAERTRRVLKWAAHAMLRDAVQLDGRSTCSPATSLIRNAVVAKIITQSPHA